VGVRHNHRLETSQKFHHRPERLALPAITLVTILEQPMKYAWLVIAIAALALVGADQALARAQRSHYHDRAYRAHCVDRPLRFSWWGILTNPPPQPNGCALPVHEYGRYVGQDPDPNIRFQLRRDPATGYTSDLYP
jgi:hypothetical protein